MTARLGDRIRDKYTGVEGIATIRLHGINGCVQFAIEPKVKDDGEVPKVYQWDEKRLEVLEANAAGLPAQEYEEINIRGPEAKTGGAPTPVLPSR